MPTFTLTDLSQDLWVDRLSVRPADLGMAVDPPWSVTKRTLRGGRRDGVDLIEVDNGALAFSIVPTRGMGIWRGRFGGDRLGWDSPVRDGPVHPGFVDLSGWGGLGWLAGFDELLVRCGLGNNGAPYSVPAAQADGHSRHTTYGLHGKVANLPASYAAIHVDPAPPHEITIEGHVDESMPFSTQVRMVTRIATAPGSNRLRVRDEFLNLGDSPGEIQMLYHWNFGPPYLEDGSRLVAPVRVIAPRDARAGEGIDHFEAYAGPAPGFAEQAYFLELHGRSGGTATLAMLRNRAGDKGVVLRFDLAQLPAFTLWKNTGGRNEGYVTGLEPATNYPNPKPFEKANGRVVPLAPGGRYAAETTLEVLNTRDAIAAVESEVRGLQGRAAPVVHRTPTLPFGPEV